jgi:uncharacterized membrane protein YtjA (UPF0391 family)
MERALGSFLYRTVVFLIVAIFAAFFGFGGVGVRL